MEQNRLPYVPPGIVLIGPGISDQMPAPAHIQQGSHDQDDKDASEGTHDTNKRKHQFPLHELWTAPEAWKQPEAQPSLEIMYESQHFIDSIPPRTATAAEVRTWLLRWRLDMPHLISIHVSRTALKNGVTERHEHGWFEDNITNVEIDGAELHGSVSANIGMTFLDAGLDLHTTILMISDIAEAVQAVIIREKWAIFKTEAEEVTRLNRETKKLLKQNKALERLQRRLVKRRMKTFAEYKRLFGEDLAQLKPLEGTDAQSSDQEQLRGPQQDPNRESESETDTDTEITSGAKGENHLKDAGSAAPGTNICPEIAGTSFLTHATYLTIPNMRTRFFKLFFFTCINIFVISSRFAVSDLFVGLAFWLAFAGLVLGLYVEDVCSTIMEQGLRFSDEERKEIGVGAQIHVLCFGLRGCRRVTINEANVRRDTYGRLLTPLGRGKWISKLGDVTEWRMFYGDDVSE